jgi:hypothetical protein
VGHRLTDGWNGMIYIRISLYVYIRVSMCLLKLLKFGRKALETAIMKKMRKVSCHASKRNNSSMLKLNRYISISGP